MKQEYMRVCAEINKEALLHNVLEIKKKVSENTKLLLVVKADGYGHGAVNVAKTLVSYADYFGVATLDEAVKLRKENIKTPILILGHTIPDTFDEAVLNDITLTVFNYEDIKQLSDIGRKYNKKVKVHIALDTGMNRIGFKCIAENANIVEKASILPNVTIEGIFSHFATADEENSEFVKKQAKEFKSFIEMLEERNVFVPIKHISNSAAIVGYKDMNLDMVRAGIILYGLYPSGEKDKRIDIIPAMELKSTVAYVKDAEAGETVSYGRTFTAEKRIKIATIPIGYADGYPRLLSNRGRVIIKGQYCKIIGRICMDQFMVDVTHIPDVKEEDIVTLIGKDGDCFIGADEVASFADTISYEIVCGISRRVPRVLK